MVHADPLLVPRAPCSCPPLSHDCSQAIVRASSAVPNPECPRSISASLFCTQSGLSRNVVAERAIYLMSIFGCSRDPLCRLSNRIDKKTPPVRNDTRIFDSVFTLITSFRAAMRCATHKYKGLKSLPAQLSHSNLYSNGRLFA